MIVQGSFHVQLFFIFTLGIVLFLLAIARAIVSIANIPIEGAVFDVMVITATFIAPIPFDCIHITMCNCFLGGTIAKIKLSDLLFLIFFDGKAI